MLFHGMAEKIDETFYKNNKEEVLNIIKIICDNLPCPYCRQNASKYLKINMRNIETKEDLKLFLYRFHNDVNKKLKKKHFSESILNKYKTINIFKHINGLIINFMANTLYHMILINGKKYGKG